MHTSRIELSFEQREIWKVTHGEEIQSIQCPFCHEPSPMLAAEKLAKAMTASPREIYKRVEDGTVHFVETGDLQVLVCMTTYSDRSLYINEKESLDK